MNERRRFLRNTVTATAGLRVLSAAGIGSLTLADALLNKSHAAISPGVDDYKSLVVINLNGGNDSLNMLIPNTQAEYDLYAANRPQIAFDKSTLLPISPAGMPADSFAMSPRMPGVRDLFASGDLSFVANVGSLIGPISKAEYLDPLRVVARPVGLGGHNTQSAYWQADHSNRINTSKEGWGGRLANEFNINSTLPINISVNTGQNIFQAHQQQLFYNVGLSGLIKLRDYTQSSSNPGIRARRKAIDALNQLAAQSADPFLEHAGVLFEQGLDLNLSLQTELNSVPDLSAEFSAPFQSFSGGAFSAGLARIAELITIRQQLGMRRQIFFVELAGFDTHSNHAENHGNLSADLSAFLKIFDSVMKDKGVHDSVLTVTTSEFGRNLASNGDGTDHAWGAQHMVMGGPVDGGKIFGTFPSLELGSTDDHNGLGRMIPTTSVSQYGATIASWFGVPQNRLSSLFPNLVNFANPDIGFIA